MKITKQLFGTLLAATALLSAAPSVKITLDKADQLYRCGEPATYTIEFTDDAAEPLAKTATYKLTNDNLTVIKTGTIDIAQSPKTIFKETMEKPSFLNLTVYCSYTDKDGKRTWKVKYTFKGAGEKSLTFRGTDRNGVFTGEKILEITVNKK